MSNELLIGFPEIAAALRCSVRKLHDPKLKRELAEKGVIFKRRYGNFGKEVWAAYMADLVQWQKERAQGGRPF